jgi:hypothetical protein
MDTRMLSSTLESSSEGEEISAGGEAEDEKEESWAIILACHLICRLCPSDCQYWHKRCGSPRFIRFRGCSLNLACFLVLKLTCFIVLSLFSAEGAPIYELFLQLTSCDHDAENPDISASNQDTKPTIDAVEIFSDPLEHTPLPAPHTPFSRDVCIRLLHANLRG